MKKIVSLGLSVLMLSSLMLLPACEKEEKKPSATIKGNYTTVSKDNAEQVENFDKVLQQINTESIENGLIGQNSKVGARFYTDLSLKANYSTLFSINADADVDVKMIMSQAAPEETLNSVMGLNITASGNFAVNADVKYAVENEDSTTTQPIAQTTELNTKANVYVDNAMTYLDYSVVLKNEGMKNEQENAVKIPTISLLDEFDIFEDIGLMTTSSTVVEDELSAEAVLEALETYGIDVAYEYSETKGSKIKLSATQDTITALLAMLSNGKDVTINNTTIPQCKLDVYVQIDKNGLITKMSVDANVNGNVMINNQLASLELKGAIVVETSNSISVTLPNGLAEDEKYKLQLT